MRSPKYSYLRNPVTGDCAMVDDRNAKRLRSYGWEWISKLEYRTWQVANVKTDRLIRAYSNVVRH